MQIKVSSAYRMLLCVGLKTTCTPGTQAWQKIFKVIEIKPEGHSNLPIIAGALRQTRLAPCQRRSSIEANMAMMAITTSSSISSGTPDMHDTDVLPDGIFP